jgi:hypothetical protein
MYMLIAVEKVFMSKRNLIAIGVLFVILLGGITITLVLLSSNQDNRSGAEAPPPLITEAPSLPPVDTQDTALDTTDPGPVTNVRVNYPYINGTASDWNQASCTWDSNSNATLYNVKVTEVDTSTEVKSEQLNSSVSQELFAINDGKTYRCEVAAVNTAGVAGTPGSDEQVCESTALVETPTPTPTETPVPTVTETPIPTVEITVAPTATPTAIPTAIPTLPPTGSIGSVVTIGIG